MTPPHAAKQTPDDSSSLSDGEFKTLLADVIPHLRAYGRSLSGNPDLADDLTQDTMVKAWASR
jgi:RNA polymerase sigma-70 factor (ECF subfamily)